VTIDTERAKHWLDHGAQPTPTVAKLLRTQGVEGPAGT
jgi:ribosomal protein S16